LEIPPNDDTREQNKKAYVDGAGARDSNLRREKKRKAYANGNGDLKKEAGQKKRRDKKEKKERRADSLVQPGIKKKKGV
jgi:hypothetical protein